MQFKKLSLVLITLVLINNSCSVAMSVQTTPVPLNTPFSATLPVTFTVVPTKTPNPKTDSSCWPVKPLQEAKDIRGSFVYTVIYPNELGSKISSFLALNVDSMQTRRIDNFGPPRLSSPDLKNIAAQLESEIFVITLDKVQTYSVPDRSYILDALLKDGRVRLYRAGEHDSGYEEGKGLALTYYILDPTANAIQKYAAFLPNYYESDGRELQYSPDMKYVLYRSSAYETEAEFTLFDLERNGVVWVGPPRDSNLVYLVDSHLTWRPKENWADLAPEWIPNTDVLTALFLDKATDQTKYYLFSTEGSVSPIADFDMTYIVNGTWSQAGGAWIVNHPTWSPNGRYLLTFGKAKDGDIGNFMYIWDRQENIVYKPCLPNETQTVVPPRIMQYSDGSRFIVQLTLIAAALPENRPFQGQVSKSYFIDPVKKVIYEIPDLSQQDNSSGTNSGEIAHLFGWMDWEIP